MFFDRPQDVGDDALLIRPDAVDAVDEEDRRSSAANLGQEVCNHAVLETERRRKGQPAISRRGGPISGTELAH